MYIHQSKHLNQGTSVLAVFMKREPGVLLTGQTIVEIM